MVAYRTLARFAGSGAKPGLSTNGGLSASYADEQREVIFTPPAGKPPLFIMLDGTGQNSQDVS